MDSDLNQGLDTWRERLLDLSGRNPAISFKETKRGTLRLTAPTPQRLFTRLFEEGQALHLCPGDGDARLPFAEAAHGPNDGEAHASLTGPEMSRTLTELGRKAKGHFEELGAHALYLALGFLRWTEAESSSAELRSPLVSAPVALDKSRTGLWTLRAEDDSLTANVALMARLRQHFGVELPSLPEDLGDGRWIDDYFAGMRGIADGRKGWSVTDEAYLGMFSFGKLVMYADLDANRSRALSHPLIRGMCGDPTALAHVPQIGLTETEVDAAVRYDNSYEVLTADASQRQAILAAQRGESFVLIGPPGTGKSQTIANVIAQCIAQGKRVLFVSQKKAALDVVYDRLSQQGLGNLCLELHAHGAKKRTVLEQLANALRDRELPTQTTVSQQGGLDEAQVVRDALNAYAQALREPYGAGQWTPWEAHGRMANLLRDPPELRASFVIPRIESLSLADVAEIEDLLTALESSCQGKHQGGPHPWRGLRRRPRDRTQCEEWTAALQWLADKVPPLCLEVQQLAVSGSLPISTGHAREQLAALTTATEALSHERAMGNSHAGFEEYFLDSIVELQLDDLRTRIARYRSNWWTRLRGWKSDKRRLTRQLRPAARLPNFGELETVLGRAHSFRAHSEQYQQLSETASVQFGSDWREAPARADRLLEQLAHAEKLINWLQEAFGRGDGPFGQWPAEEVPLTTLCGWASERVATDPLWEYACFRKPALELKLRGLGELVGLVEQAPVPVGRLVNAFHRRFWELWLRSAYAQRPALGDFNLDVMDRKVGEFQRLDRATVESAAERVCRRIAARPWAPPRDQLRKLKHQVGLQKPRVALRRLFSEIPDLLPELTPCLLMSPLSVSQYLACEQIQFDLVVFDEASQVRPEDALAAIMRGTAVVVAGDPDQLPPTDFFQTNLDDDYDEDAEIDAPALESILDECITRLPKHSLRWHYRSRHESLIAFSNHHIYRGRLVTFPAAADGSDLGVLWVPCPDGVYGRGGTRNNMAEARKVAQLAAELCALRPDDTLGVVAMSEAQARAILDAFSEQPHAQDERLQGRLNAEGERALFVKNLETVQGDERDVIILSVGYGRDAAGRLTRGFGPLNRDGGRRRLNVAVTRARKQVILVSSISDEDLPSGQDLREGAGLLVEYMRYARQSPEARAAGFAKSSGRTPDSDFEVAVRDALQERGLDVVTQVGCSHYSIDLAVRHPQKPGRFVLAVECDGATYHSTRAARDRDRLRQAELEKLGWRFCRIWSTDWWQNQETQIGRVLAAYEQALGSERD